MVKPQPTPLLVTPPGTIPRADAARSLAVSTTMVDLFVMQGRLRAEKKNGRVYIHTESLTTLRKSYSPSPRARAKALGKGRISGGVAAAVFACFEQGMLEIGKVVIATKADTETVRRLFCEWKKPLECED